jgi:hypothetical protein
MNMWALSFRVHPAPYNSQEWEPLCTPDSSKSHTPNFRFLLAQNTALNYPLKVQYREADKDTAGNQAIWG